jgi:DNA-binding transcriptional LysR family regulator
VDVHSRRLRYFVVLAQELHFSRAAARMHIAQQALSKQIRELEDVVGAQLLRRSTRKVELTPAGATFLEAARASLAALDQGVDTARRLARGETGTLRLGYVVGGALELTRPILEEFSRCHPQVELELREHDYNDRSAGLAAGSSDVAFVRAPISTPGVVLRTLFTEPLLVALPSGHRLAEHDRVPVSELANETIVARDTGDPSADGFWTLDDHRAPGAPRRIVHAHSLTEELSLVAAGRACSITTAAAARYTPHPSIRYVPIDDAAASQLALGWREDARSPVVERFLELAEAVRDRETELLHTIEHPALG